MKKQLIVMFVMMIFFYQNCMSGTQESPNLLYSNKVLSLDGTDWVAAPDVQNVGRDQQWWVKPTPAAKPAKVPVSDEPRWLAQDVVPLYNGVAWYWKDFTAPANPHKQGLYLLRFWAVHYKADVWVNGVSVGSHEGGEEMFVLDITKAIKQDATNRIAVRVLNPTEKRIDGITLSEIPHSWTSSGGILDSVELLMTPPIWTEDLYVSGDPDSGDVPLQVKIRSACKKREKGRLSIIVAPAAGGEPLDTRTDAYNLEPGDTTIKTQLKVQNPHLWNIDDPYLYRVTVRIYKAGSRSFDEKSVRFGFRDFRFVNGYFRLNGKRLFLRGALAMGYRNRYDAINAPLERQFIDMKTMGCNLARVHLGMARREQLDFADEIGLLVYEESFAAHPEFVDSPLMAERFDRSIMGMVKRDRNHPSVVIWGLMNESNNSAVFHQAVACLPQIRRLDTSRVVLLNSGRLDGYTKEVPIPAWYNAEQTLVRGPSAWRYCWQLTPNVTRNETDDTMKIFKAGYGAGSVLDMEGTTWAPGQLALHPGLNGEYSIVRWTAPTTGEYTISAVFTGIAPAATTDIHILHNGKSVYDSFINSQGNDNSVTYSKSLAIKKGDNIDAAVGPGDGPPCREGLNVTCCCDNTALSLIIKSSAGEVYDVAKDFSSKLNPNGAWTFGYLPPALGLEISSFRPYIIMPAKPGTYMGGISNPGSTQWQDILSHQHLYPRIPHTPNEVDKLRQMNGGDKNVLLAEYGIGAAQDVVRLARLCEQNKIEGFKGIEDRFLSDWRRWNMADAFGRPEDFFAQAIAKMASKRLLGLNAIRSNPHMIGHVITGALDRTSGLGLISPFGEFKPGTIDAVAESFAPLRWCLFVEPSQIYRKVPARFEVILANEDVLSQGTYPISLQIIGPNEKSVLDRQISINIADPKTEPPFALKVFDEKISIDGPSGKYRFAVNFERGAAAIDGELEFYVTDPIDMPPVNTEIVLWGQDERLAQWLSDNGIKTRAFSNDEPKTPQIILAGSKPAAGGEKAFSELAQCIKNGSVAVFLCPEIFGKSGIPSDWPALAKMGEMVDLGHPVWPKDDWAKKHPIFAGLPCGQILDHEYYRDIIPDLAWVSKETPAEVIAGANNTSREYSSGLLVCAVDLGSGRFILNTLRIRENLGRNPVAERLLRNMLRYAACDITQPLVPLPVASQLR
jgi:hypothetical protein